MATTLNSNLTYASSGWAGEWQVPNSVAWGHAEPADLKSKTATFATVLPPASLPGNAFMSVTSGDADAWAAVPVANVGHAGAKSFDPLIITVQAPPVMPAASFVDVVNPNAWDPHAQPQSHFSGVPYGPQRSIKLRQAGGNIEAELRHQDLYKTEICRSFRETGACRYGSKCQFAHGEHELRPVMRHPKYKTEICRNFTETGTCPYGTRCRFVHYQRQTSRDSMSDSPLDLTPRSSVGSDQDTDVDSVSSELASLSLSAPAEEVKEKSKGSRLPFFQKLRFNTSGEKDPSVRK